MAQYAKAIIGALVATLGVVATGLTDDSAGGSSMVAGEWVAAAIAGLTALGAIWAVPNRPPAG